MSRVSLTQVSIDNHRFDALKPLVVPRITPQIFTTTNAFKARQNYTTMARWTVFSIDASNYQPLGTVFLDVNPSTKTSALKLSSGKLGYGLYKIVYNFTTSVASDPTINWSASD
jgi:hypothetical protein